MKARTAVTISMLAVMLVITGMARTEATPPSWGPGPGFEAELTALGAPESGGQVEMICRFSIDPDAYGTKNYDSMLALLKRQKQTSAVEYYMNKTDSVIIYGNNNVTVLGPTVWTGKIQPGVQYEFRTVALIKSQYESKVYANGHTRYGNQMFGVQTFALGKQPTAIGYVTDVIVDSLGNYWHKHKAVSDSTQPEFVRFDSSNTVPLDTLYDRSGKVLSVQQVTVRAFDFPNSTIKLPGKPPRIQARPPVMIQQKPTTRKKTKGTS